MTPDCKILIPAYTDVGRKQRAGRHWYRGIRVPGQPGWAWRAADVQQLLKAAPADRGVSVRVREDGIPVLRVSWSVPGRRGAVALNAWHLRPGEMR